MLNSAFTHVYCYLCVIIPVTKPQTVFMPSCEIDLLNLEAVTPRKKKSSLNWTLAFIHMVEMLALLCS